MIDFYVKIDFSNFVPAYFCWKNQSKMIYFVIPKFQKMQTTLFFPLFFAKNENFNKFTSRWSEKKIFRDCSDGPKMMFKTLLWYAAMKKYGRLMKFSHFWWFLFLIFGHPKNAKNRFFKKCKILIFFFQFHQFLLVFHVFPPHCFRRKKIMIHQKQNCFPQKWWKFPSPRRPKMRVSKKGIWISLLWLIYPAGGRENAKFYQKRV